MFTMEELHEIRMIAQSICDLRPGCDFALPQPDYATLVWKTEGIDPPTPEEIAEQVKYNKDLYESRKWIRDRLGAYPAIQDQLDTIFHHGIDAWKQTIQEVKDKHPKPEGAPDQVRLSDL
jgi:hypothetical protein